MHSHFSVVVLRVQYLHVNTRRKLKGKETGHVFLLSEFRVSKAGLSSFVCTGSAPLESEIQGLTASRFLRLGRCQIQG